MDAKKALWKKEALWGRNTPKDVLKSGLLDTLQEHLSSRVDLDKIHQLEMLLGSNEDGKLQEAFEVLGQYVKRFVAGLDVSQTAAMVFFAQYFIRDIVDRQLKSKGVEGRFLGKRAVSYIENNQNNHYQPIHEHSELAMLLEAYFLAYPSKITGYYKTLKNSDLIDRLSKPTVFNSFGRIKLYFDVISLNRTDFEYGLDVYEVFVKDISLYNRIGFMRNKKTTQHLVFIYLAGLYEAHSDNGDFFNKTLYRYVDAVDVSEKLLKKFKGNAPEFYNLADGVLASYDGYSRRPRFTHKESESNIVWLVCMLDKVTYYEGNEGSFKGAVRDISAAWSKRNRVSKKKKVPRSYFLITIESHEKMNNLRGRYSTQAQFITGCIEVLCGKKAGEIQSNTEAIKHVDRLTLLETKAKAGVTVDIPSSTNRKIDKLKKQLGLTRSQIVELSLAYDEFEQEAPTEEAPPTEEALTEALTEAPTTEAPTEAPSDSFMFEDEVTSGQLEGVEEEPMELKPRLDPIRAYLELIKNKS